MVRYRQSKYLVTENGRVWSEKHKKFLKPNIGKTGYYKVSLYINEKAKTCNIHRLVAELYLENPNNYSVVNHLDCNKLNNEYSNLEWCTTKMNVHHALKQKRIPVGENNYLAKVTEKDVKEIRELYKTGKFSQRDIGEIYGLKRSTTRDIIFRDTWKHVND